MGLNGAPGLVPPVSQDRPDNQLFQGILGRNWGMDLGQSVEIKGRRAIGCAIAKDQRCSCPLTQEMIEEKGRAVCKKRG